MVGSGFQSFWNFPTDSYRVTIYSPLLSVTSEIGYENYKSSFYELNINTVKNSMQNLNWSFENSSSSLNLKTEKRKNIGPLQKLCNGPTVHWFHEANGPMGPNTKSHQNSAISVENFQFPIRHTKWLGFLYTNHVALLQLSLAFTTTLLLSQEYLYNWIYNKIKK